SHTSRRSRSRAMLRPSQGRPRYAVGALLFVILHVRHARAPAAKGRKAMTLKRMDNVLIVVDDLEAAKAFFIELGLKLEGETTVEGPAVASLIGLREVRATLAMMRTPDGQGIELDKFHTPNAIRFGPVDAPVNALGIRRVMFAVDDIDAVVARMRARSEEHTSELQSPDHLVCRLLLEKKKST